MSAIFQSCTTLSESEKGTAWVVVNAQAEEIVHRRGGFFRAAGQFFMEIFDDFGFSNLAIAPTHNHPVFFIGI